MTDYIHPSNTLPIAEVNRLIEERIVEFKRRGLDYGNIGPLHPRAMLYLLDHLLWMP